ncbi:SEL1-like repeat protein|uniref:tetratricopeptide repeat protein n=1 Tax=Noviherbaspirillum sp. L7-7A TaxID=2850560 RepID=UPI001C2C7C15|nr:tetratricopeptide repeat protein [Noviherbaspirillum sp. L7-7A]MBV0880638.1 SEL1-like repeat protein [Noviherbaspirillum sp. L7-7A]
MQSSNPTDGTSGSSFSYVLSDSDSTPVDGDSCNGQAATGQDGATRQPRLHAGNRSGTPLLSDADARLPDDHAQAIGVLNEHLRPLRGTNPIDLEQVLQFFDAIKASEQKLKAFMRDDPHDAALRRLADGLYVLLPRLRVLLCGDGSASLDINTIHTLCMGLSTCVAPAAGTMFEKERLQRLRPDLQAITDVLMERACEAGLPAATASIGVVLDILNWASRALKAECIEVSQPIEKVFNKALTVFEESLAGKLNTCGLTTHQLGKCAVQINTIFQFRLIKVDSSEKGLAGRRRLATCGEWLCSSDMAARLGTGRVDAVACTNVCNLVKDMMAHGLLPAATNVLLSQGLAGLVGVILRISADQMLADDCRTLSNCANFLRVLGEHGASLPEQALVPNWVAASHALLGVMNDEAFMDCLPSGQAVANLISFVKRCDRHLRQSLPAGGTTTTMMPARLTTTTAAATAPATDSTAPGFAQDQLRRAANHLIQHSLHCTPDAFTGPKTLSGLLSGLDYVVRRNLASATPELKTFMAGLMDNMAWCSSTWKEKSRMVALPALRGLLSAKLVTLAQAQPGLAALLGPCNNPSGYSMEDLAAAIRDRGVIEDEVLALPPAEAVLKVLTSPSRKAIRPALPPGYTRIIPPSTASSSHSDRGRMAAPTFRAATSLRTTTLAAANKPESQGWHSPRKVARANRQTEAYGVRSAALPQAQQPAPSMAATPPQRKAEPQPKPASATPRKPATHAKPAQKRHQQTSRALNPTARPEDEWFDLLNSRDPEALERLKRLAGQPGLLNRKKGKGLESLGALACALASGQLTVVMWLLAPETGYRFDEQIGPFLSAVQQNIALLDDEVITSLDYFLARQDEAARTDLQRHFATHQPTSVAMQNLLERHGLIAAETKIPTFKTTTTETGATTTTTTTTTTAGNRQTFDPEDAQAQIRLGDCYWNGTGVSVDKAQAFAWYSAAANQGLAEAQLRLGNCYWNGTGVSVDKAQAFAWYRAAANQGLAEAQSGVGYCYQKGIGVKEHKARAAGWYRTAARNGDANAQYNLGMCHEFGIGVNVNMATAFEWFGKAAHQGLAQAQFALGNCYENGTGVKKDMAAAFAWISKAAYQGLAEAQLNLGMCYEHGAGVIRDYAKAAECYEKAANQGLARAQVNLGNCYWNGTGVTRDYARAAECYEKAANQRFADAQVNLGNCYWYGRGVPKDYAKAMAWYGKAANQGLADAQVNLGNCYRNGTGVPKDDAKAFAWYEKAAIQGVAGAQDNLGNCYWNGIGVSKDYAKAAEWYEKAASQGFAGAELNLGSCYWNGTGVPKDDAEALAWYEKAANQGLAEAQFIVGNFYWNGIGVKEDKARAIRWLGKAANQGYAKAQFDLGTFLLEGKSVKKDQDQAIEWYRTAANQGLVEAQFSLGRCYWYGIGVHKDTNQATQWFRKAADQGYTRANEFLN